MKKKKARKPITATVPVAKAGVTLSSNAISKKRKKRLRKLSENVTSKKFKAESSYCEEDVSDDIKIENNEKTTVKNDENKNNQTVKKNEPFRRVNEDEVDKNLLQKIGKNDFEYKKGAESSWGSKANLDLKHTQGKSFRHEKNKKKRGSYRGGKIDTKVYSIKFDD